MNKELPEQSQELTIEFITGRLQELCHTTVAHLMDASPKISYQDATNTWLFERLAKIEYRLVQLEKQPIPSPEQQPKEPEELREFLAACINERNNFCDSINSTSWSTTLRTMAEDILIMYDQLMQRLENTDPQQPTEGMYREFDSNKYYWCKCENCGWEDSSQFLEGCSPIADTGDHSDPVCPICFGNSIEAEPTINIPEDYTGVHKVFLPFDLIIEPYKKALKQVNENFDNLRFGVFQEPIKAEGMYTEAQIKNAAEKEIDEWKKEGDEKRTDWDYQKLGFVQAVIDQLSSLQPKQP